MFIPIMTENKITVKVALLLKKPDTLSKWWHCLTTMDEWPVTLIEQHAFLASYVIKFFANLGVSLPCPVCKELMTVIEIIDSAHVMFERSFIVGAVVPYCGKDACLAGSSSLLRLKWSEQYKELGRASACYAQCRSCGRYREPDEGKFKKCSRCWAVRYCSVACQKGDWSEHKKICFDKKEKLAETGGGSSEDRE